MKIVDMYSFNQGKEKIEESYSYLLDEVLEVIEQIDPESCRQKDPVGAERNRLRRIDEEKFYSPDLFNAVFDYYLLKKGWELKPRIQTNAEDRDGYREMDAIKEKVGLEIQFGKYAFLTYDIVAKMPIFRKYGMIEYGIEIVVTQCMLPHMSSGIGAFEQLKWDLEERGAIENFDVPTLVIGIASEKTLKGRKDDRKENMLPGIGNERKATVIRDRVPTLTPSDLKKILKTGLEI